MPPMTYAEKIDYVSRYVVRGYDPYYVWYCVENCLEPSYEPNTIRYAYLKMSNSHLPNVDRSDISGITSR